MRGFAVPVSPSSRPVASKPAMRRRRAKMRSSASLLLGARPIARFLAERLAGIVELLESQPGLTEQEIKARRSRTTK
jgi:hypothetical protein